MATLGEVNIRLGIIDNLKTGLSKAERRLNRFGRIAGNIGNTLSQNLTLPLVGLGIAAVKSAGDFEQYEKGLASMMGSAEAAKKEIMLLKEAAKEPGLDLTQAVKGSVRLQAVNVSADLARKALSNFGNAIALAGGTSADLDGVTLALTQIISKGKISAEEINQLAERVPQVRNAIQTAFGTGDSEQLQKLGISAEEFVEKVTEEMGKLPKASSGISNAINNTGQAITAFLVSLGNDINKTFNLTERIENFGARLGELADRFAAMDKGTKRTVLAVAAFVAGVGPAIKIVSLFTNTISSFVGIAKLFVANLRNLLAGIVSAGIKFKALDNIMKATTIGAVVAVVAAGAIAFNQWSKSMSSAQQVARTLNDVNVEANKAIADERIELEKVKRVLDSETASKKEKIVAVNRLNALSPEYLGGLSLEKNNIEEITMAMDGYLNRLEKRARLQAANEKLVEIERQLLDAQDEINNPENLNFFDQAGNLAIKVATGFDGATVAAVELSNKVKALTDQKAALLDFIQAAETPILASTPTSTPTSVTRSNTSQEQDNTKQLQKDLAEELKIRDFFIKKRQQQNEEKIGGIINSNNITFDGLGAIDNTALAAFNETLNQTSTLFEPVSAEALRMSERLKEVKLTAAEMGQTLYDTALQSSAGFKELGKAALKSAAMVVKAKIMEGVSGLISKLIGTGPLGLFLAPAAGAAAGAIFNTILNKLKIPAFADGVTNFAGGMALVGERGPEVVTLPRGSNVIPNDVAFGGGQNITVTGYLMGRGDQLVAVIDKARQNRTRIGL